MSPAMTLPQDPAPPTDAAVEATLLGLAAARAPGSTDPEAVARALAGEHWRAQLGAVRRAAVALARAGRIDVLRKGRPVDPSQEVRGVIRLRLRPPADPVR
jgi:hypothetical protein